jgi:hypothetical protein
MVDKFAHEMHKVIDRYRRQRSLGQQIYMAEISLKPSSILICIEVGF